MAKLEIKVDDDLFEEVSVPLAWLEGNIWK